MSNATKQQKCWLNPGDLIEFTRSGEVGIVTAVRCRFDRPPYEISILWSAGDNSIEVAHHNEFLHSRWFKVILRMPQDRMSHDDD